MTDPTCTTVVHLKLQLHVCFSLTVVKIIFLPAVKKINFFLASFQILPCQSHKNIFKALVYTLADIFVQWQRHLKVAAFTAYYIYFKFILSLLHGCPLGFFFWGLLNQQNPHFQYQFYDVIF